MGGRSRIFVDFWNFQLNWNERSAGANCDWPKLPRVLLDSSRDLLQTMGLTDPLDLEETLVYASVKNSPEETNLKRWLQSFLDRQPSFRVKIRERRTQSGGVWCNTCKQSIDQCPGCNAPLQRAREKGVDAAIVTDRLSLAWEQAFDLAILVSSDADFVPAVERVQEKGLKVINATWAGRGFDLAHSCWGSFELDKVIGLLVRS